jgi:hypothetical protein
LIQQLPCRIEITCRDRVCRSPLDFVGRADGKRGVDRDTQTGRARTACTVSVHGLAQKGFAARRSGKALRYLENKVTETLRCFASCNVNVST